MDTTLVGKQKLIGLGEIKMNKEFEDFVIEREEHL